MQSAYKFKSTCALFAQKRKKVRAETRDSDCYVKLEISYLTMNYVSIKSDFLNFDMTSRFVP